jgi:hypothetical protein
MSSSPPHIDYKISAFRECIETLDSYQRSKLFLKQMRNTPIGTYSLKDSRCIWMSLLIYKFKNEMDANDIIWGKSRSVILALLRQDAALPEIIQDYLLFFNEWKANDLQQFVLEIASFYYNILQIKQSIERDPNDMAAIQEWAPHYSALLEKVRTSCSKLGCLPLLDSVVEQMNEQKTDIVAEILNRAYWDKMEEDIAANNCEIIFLNMLELKTFLNEILPEKISRKELDAFIDIDFLKQRVHHNTFDRDYLLNMFNFVMNLLSEWDAIHYRQRYMQEKVKIQEMDVPLPKLIRLVLEKCFFYTMDLKNRKGIWNKVLNNEMPSSS